MLGDMENEEIVIDGDINVRIGTKCWVSSVGKKKK